MEAVIDAGARLILTASVFLLGTPGWAQAPLPCSDVPQAGTPTCGEDRQSPPVALELLFPEASKDQALSWSEIGDVTWRSGGVARLSGGGAVEATIPLINRSGPIVVFEVSASGLAAPNGAAIAEYFDGGAWRPLASIPGSREPAQYMFWLRDVANVAAFKLRFRVTGPEGYAYVGDVSVWAPRIMPPPVSPP